MRSDFRLDRVQSLKSILVTKPEGKRLLSDFERIRNRAIPFLSKITETFPEFTIHDVRHSDKVISILDWLLVDELKNALNSYEIFFLLASAILHDIGMANIPFLLETDENFGTFFAKKRALNVKKDEILVEYIRSTHNLRSERFIIEKYDDLSIDNKIQAQIIGRICRGHRDNLKNKDLYDHRTMYRSYPINIPLLADLLQLADELDLDFERAPVILFNAIEIANPLTKVEWEKHLSITGIGPNVDDPLSVFINASCTSDKVHRALKRAEMKIQELLHKLPDHLHQHRKFRLVIPQRIGIAIDQQGYKVYDLKFTLHEREIFDLLMGEKIYDRKTACLRELIQNALDTCRQRSFDQADYNPKITFSIDRNSRTMVVSDNGLGMNMDIIGNYFTKIGLCFYRSPEFLEERYDFTPVSQFGIGILSCFMLANRIVIDTKMDGYDPLRIEMTSAFDYISIKLGNKKSQGTAVKLYLKEEIDLDSSDLKKEIGYYARHLDIPIRIQISGKRSSWVRAKPFRCNLKDFAPESPTLRRLGLTVTQWTRLAHQYLDVINIPIKEKNIEGNIGFLSFKDEKFLAPISGGWSKKWNEISTQIGNRIGFKALVSNEGIYICDIRNELERFISAQGVIFDINLKGATARLNISRTGFVRDDEYDNIVYVLLDAFFTYFEKTLEAIIDSPVEKDKKITATHFFFDCIDLESVRNRVLGHISASTKLLERLHSRLKPLYEKAFYFSAIINGRYDFLRYEKLRDYTSLIIFPAFTVISKTEHSATSMPIDICSIVSRASDFQKVACKGEIHLVSPDEHSNKNYCYIIYMLDKKLYDSIDELSLDERIHWIKMLGFEEIIPKEFHPVKFKNYNTERFIEIIPKRTMGPKPQSSFEIDSHRLINADHPFMKLLAKVIPEIKDKTITSNLRTFFSLVIDIDRFHEASQIQMMILKELRRRKLVDHPRRFMLREKDFPAHAKIPQRVRYHF